MPELPLMPALAALSGSTVVGRAIDKTIPGGRIAGAPRSRSKLIDMPGSPQITNLDQATVVALGPEFKNITEDIVPSASSYLMAAAGDEKPNMILDFTNVEFFGSSFIEVLFRVWKRLQQRGGGLAFANVSTFCQEVLKTTNLDSLWPVCATIDDAAKRFNAKA